MVDEERDRVTIAVHAPDRAFAPGVQTALMRLGYNLISARTASRQRATGVLAPEVRIVDTRQCRDLAARQDPLPRILLAGAKDAIDNDDELLGVVQRRARLTQVYQILQNHFEDQPRSVPRVHDALPARATRGAESWTGAIRSISERGCLLQSASSFRSDTQVELCFPLASQGLVQIPAEPCYQSEAGTGMVFNRLPETTRNLLADYVTSRLVA